MLKSFTHDEGKERPRHVDLTVQTGTKVYFRDSHSPWERGTCENTIDLIRNCLPTGDHLNVFNQDDLDGIADTLNNSLRATREWHTPLQVFGLTLTSAHRPSPSAH